MDKQKHLTGASCPSRRRAAVVDAGTDVQVVWKTQGNWRRKWYMQNLHTPLVMANYLVQRLSVPPDLLRKRFGFGCGASSVKPYGKKS